MIRLFIISLTVVLKLYPTSLLEGVSKEDEERLELFFENLIKYSTLGYSLCGDKPVSLEHVPDLNRAPVLKAPKAYFTYSWYSIIGLGWECWLRNAHRFPSKNYCLRSSDDLHAIILINKKATLKVISENIDLFQKQLNTNQSPAEILNELCTSEHCMILNSNHVINGLLFGYGKNNTLAFTSARNCQRLKNFSLGTPYKGLSDHFGPGFKIQSDEINFQENDLLKKKYQMTKQKIRSSFHKSTYLNQFLKYYLAPNEQS